MKDERIIKEAWLTAGRTQGKGSELYEALVEGKYITRRTTAIRATKYSYGKEGSRNYLLVIKNASNKNIFSARVTDFQMNNTMEEF